MCACITPQNENGGLDGGSSRPPCRAFAFRPARPLGDAVEGRLVGVLGVVLAGLGLREGDQGRFLDALDYALGLARPHAAHKVRTFT